MLQYIGFRLHTGEYAIPITRVREIVNIPAVTTLPQSPAYLRGVTNLRGNVIPLVNLSKLINIPENGSGGTKVIVIVSGRLTFGIIVDGITGVLSLDESTIESPEGLSHARSQEITGVAKIDGRLIVLLDTGKLIPVKDLSLLEEVLTEVRDIGGNGTVEVTKTMQNMGGEVKVKEVFAAREYFEKTKKISEDDPRREIFEGIVEFMNAVSEHDYTKADAIMQHVAKQGQGDLFQEVGKITRKLHDTIQSFKEALDPRLKDIASTNIPNAVDRLQFVIDKTEEAANKTMSVVEKYILRMDDLSAHIRKVQGPPETTAYLKDFKNTLEEDLTEIVTTQSFQDITGQTIKKVITLVGDIESELVRLISSFGVKIEASDKDLQVAAEKVSQAGVDDLLKEFGF